ncbi:MAG: hypothetical protein ACLP9L_13190 [Thermoguttaceae bacterium]
MGACCYSPTKRDFLWWYWLLLASIVGIPMFLAVLYVAWQPEAHEQRKKARGIRAAWIFWIGTLIVAFAAFCIVQAYLKYTYSDESDGYWKGWSGLSLQLVFATIMANLTNEWTRKQKRWYVRILLTVFGVICFLLPLLALSPEIALRLPAINIMQFMVCMLPAHCWGQFKDAPDARHAWRALLAFLAAAPLVFLAGYFGEDLARFVVFL